MKAQDQIYFVKSREYASAADELRNNYDIPKSEGIRLTVLHPIFKEEYVMIAYHVDSQNGFVVRGPARPIVHCSDYRPKNWLAPAGRDESANELAMEKLIQEMEKNGDSNALLARKILQKCESELEVEVRQECVERQ